MKQDVPGPNCPFWAKSTSQGPRWERSDSHTINNPEQGWIFAKMAAERGSSYSTFLKQLSRRYWGLKSSLSSSEA
jgi:hypothetical protein